MPRVGIALGSNLGDRLANICSAREKLASLAIPGEPMLFASVYQTEPVLCPEDSPMFYNSVIEISFSGSPFELLEKTQAIEQTLGRTQAPGRNAPRVIDIDLLYFGDESVTQNHLELPHPRIADRRFVLEPLAEIRPNLILSGKTSTISELLAVLSSPEPPLVRVNE